MPQSPVKRCPAGTVAFVTRASALLCWRTEASLHELLIRLPTELSMMMRLSGICARHDSLEDLCASHPAAAIKQPLPNKVSVQKQLSHILMAIQCSPV